MRNLTIAGLGILSLALLLLSFTLIPANTAPTNTFNGLVVHEWGTFTSVRNRDGQALLWRPLSFESDLPPFVYSIDKGQTWKSNDLSYRTKSATRVTVRMETPVLYFYASEPTEAKIKVSFPKGIITEWYPQGSPSYNGIDWTELKVFPNLRVELPHNLTENHYYAARETESSILEVAGDEKKEYEKFLFYRGVGNPSLPLSLKLRDENVIITNASPDPPVQAILFENKDGQIGFTRVELTQAETSVNRPARGKAIADLRQELKTMLIAAGLFEKEADAMLNTWRDSWFEEGLRLFYIMPRKTTDAILPLAIEPQPASIVRVLVGRTELITPDAERNVSTQLLKLNDPSRAVRTAARKQIDRYGRFVESILTQISATPANQKVKTAAEQLLAELNRVAGT
jgi:hypothetical protein